ncbi:MAG: TPD domain-containing protein [Candidatus Poseidonia sp.]|nr:TPD domain-containing protein [Poseidonia sp.]
MGESPRPRRSSNQRRRSSSQRRYGGPKRSTQMERFTSEIASMNADAEARFERSPLPMAFPKEMDPPRTFHLSWKPEPVPLKAEERVASFVVKRGDFGWLNDDRVDEIASSLEGEAMTLDQALSLRSALLQQKTVYSHHKLKSKARELARHYRSGTSVVALSKKYDFPPMNIFRVVLEAMGWSKKRIKDSLRNPSSMKQREQDEFEAAEAADRVSSVDQSETQVKADLFEDILADWFEAQGIRLRRQPEMVKEQSELLGRPVRTPDLLFLDHVYINDQPVAWIDAKHFYGADVEFQRKKMKKQMNRYIEEWGSGAIMFRHGFSENLFLPGVLMLDAAPIDLSALTAGD